MVSSSVRLIPRGRRWREGRGRGDEDEGETDEDGESDEGRAWVVRGSS